MKKTPSTAPRFELATEAGTTRLLLTGTWRMAQLPSIEQALYSQSLPAVTQVDGSALQQLDSAAALLLCRALAKAGSPAPAWVGFSQTHERIVNRVQSHLIDPPVPQAPRRAKALAQVGRTAAALGAMLLGHVNFLGATLTAMAQLLPHPGRLRLRELTVQVQQIGLNAIPVVALVTALIGVVVAYLLGLQAEKYGANIFVVDGVAIGATREFSPIIVAVIVAGRSGAAFTAQLGSMRLTEETDAIRTLGLDPMQVLVLPRVLALMVALPLLVFVGDVMALLGAMAIAQPMLDITPVAFITRLHQELALRHVLVGLFKAPVFALFIAVIGARMGMTVARDTRALGAATTSTVVQSIVAVILLDAAFAILLQAMQL